MKQFYFEVTDTYAGEANYCWVKRLKINANSLHGALIKLSKYMGLNFRRYDEMRYNAKGACICAFIIDSEYSIISDGDTMETYKFIDIE